MKADRKLFLENIRTFLTRRGWTSTAESGRFSKYRPPLSLGLGEDFTLTLPRDETAADTNMFLQRIAATVAAIYDLSPDQLDTLFASADTVLSIQLIGLSTAEGSVPFVHFEAMVEGIRKILLDVATFVAYKTPLNDESAAEAYTYLDNCSFLQTERGSFVAKIQLPAAQVLHQPTLFDQEPLLADAVTQRLIKVLDFVVGPVFEKREDLYSEDFFSLYPDVINVDVLEDIDSLFKKTGSDTLRFSFLSTTSSKVISSGLLSADKTICLSNYIAFLKEQITLNLSVDLIGKIVELRSRNPESNRNYILMTTAYEDQKAFLAIHLNNTDYQTAIQAHRTNRQVRVRGKAKRMKTQLKITQLDSLEEV